MYNVYNEVYQEVCTVSALESTIGSIVLAMIVVIPLLAFAYWAYMYCNYHYKVIED